MIVLDDDPYVRAAVSSQNVPAQSQEGAEFGCDETVNVIEQEVGFVVSDLIVQILNARNVFSLA